MPEIVVFTPDDTDQSVCIEILEKALDKAKAGLISDVAVVAVVNDGSGPVFEHSYWGEGRYATLVAGVSALEFDLHYRRYQESEPE